MHWDPKYRRQQRRKAITILAVGLFVFASIGYLFFETHSIKNNQEKQLTQIHEDLLELKEIYSNDIQKVTKSLEQRFENVEEIVVSTKEEYDKNTENLLESAQKVEQTSLELEELKREFRSSSGDMSQIISKVVKSAVSVTSLNSQGSGAVISTDGYIVTNSHLLIDDEPVTIIDYNGRASSGEIIIRDPFRDLAIIKTDKTYSDFLELGNSDKAKVGEAVIAIGSPKGLDLTVTQGIISATNRVIEEVKGAFIQTDVPINVGSSGGPLINSEGKLVGINTFKLKGTESLGFAIPSNDVKEIFESLNSLRKS